MNTPWVLLSAALSVGAVHTVTGVDHSLPFVVLAKARKWSLARTCALVLACGAIHVLSSVALGLVGIYTGEALTSLLAVEEHRGSLAGWLLIGFGLAYAAWGLVQSRRARTHSHVHVHEDGTVHDHEHDHHAEHLHPHADPSGRRYVTGWALFVIFGLGPCEPLIPMMMAAHSTGGAAVVALVCAGFGLVTLATMVAVVVIGYRGLSFARLPSLERHAHALAGGAIAVSGLTVALLGM